MEPLVSVIIPCYNDFLYIEQAVRSAIDQTYPFKEIIVIDDGSDKQTKEVLKKLEHNIDTLITQENLGVIEARNRAINLSKGKYILTLDSDDYFEPSFLLKAVKILENNENVGMVTCWINIRDEKGNKLRIDKPTGGNAFSAMFFNNAPASLLFRKRCWQMVNGYDENLKNGYEDWEFNIAVGKLGWEVHVIPVPLFNYTKRIKSRSKVARNYYNEIRNYTFQKHHDLLSNNINQTIYYLLSEIEKKNRLIHNLRNSRSYKLWKVFVKPFRKFGIRFFNNG